MAQIKVGDKQKNPKAINVFFSGQWVLKKIGYVFKKNVWEPFIRYLLEIYTNGIEHVGIVKGYSSSYGAVTKGSSNIRLYFTAIDDQNAEVSITTNTLIDLTGYSKVKIEWAQSANIPGSQFRLLVSPVASGNFANNVTASFERIGEIRKTIDDLDISQLSGSYYIRVHCRPNAYNRFPNLYIYRIWLE